MNVAEKVYFTAGKRSRSVIVEEHLSTRINYIVNTACVQGDIVAKSVDIWPKMCYFLVKMLCFMRKAIINPSST